MKRNFKIFLFLGFMYLFVISWLAYFPLQKNCNGEGLCTVTKPGDIIPLWTPLVSVGLLCVAIIFFRKQKFIPLIIVYIIFFVQPFLSNWIDWQIWKVTREKAPYMPVPRIN